MPIRDQRDEITIAQVIELYFRKAPEQNPVALENKRCNAAGFAALHGKTRVRDARRYDLIRWVESHDAWQSPWTRRRAAAEIRSIFGWAARLDLIRVNPFTQLSLRKGDPGRGITCDEYQMLLRHSSPLFRRVLIFLRYTGCRPGEMSAAKWEDVDLRRCVITLRQHKTAVRTGLPRQIILHPVIVKLLAWIQRDGPNQKWIFTNSAGTQWKKNTLYCRIAQIRQLCGIASDVSLYSLRHGFAVDAILSGVDIATLAPLMGHQDIAMTSYYARVAGKTDHLQAAMRKISHRKPQKGD